MKHTSSRDRRLTRVIRISPIIFALCFGVFSCTKASAEISPERLQICVPGIQFNSAIALSIKDGVLTCTYDDGKFVLSEEGLSAHSAAYVFIELYTKYPHERKYVLTIPNQSFRIEITAAGMRKSFIGIGDSGKPHFNVEVVEDHLQEYNDGIPTSDEAWPPQN